AARPALPDGRVYRTLVDGRRIRRHLHRSPHPAPTVDVGGAGTWPVLLRGGSGADDARGRILRPATDLGCRKRERGSTCLMSTHRTLPFPNRGRSPESRRGSPW